MKPRRRPASFQETKLLTAMAEEGCPACLEIAGTDDHYFFWFFNENYYESFTLDALTRSLGFCLTHGARLTRARAGSEQLSAVHEVLVRRIRSVLSDLRSERPPAGPGGSALAIPARCPVCRDREDGAKGVAFWLARLLEDPAGAERYARPGILCYPHLQAVLPRVSAATLERPLLAHETAMTSAMESLAELQAELRRSRSDGRQDLVKALLPALCLAVGQEADNGAYPSWSESQNERRDPVSDLLDGLRQAEACPICLEVRRAWVEWMSWLDGAAARTSPIEDLLPTCPEHVWPAVHLGGPFLAVATTRHALSVALGQIRAAIRIIKPPTSKAPERPVERVKRVLLGPRRRVRAAREVLARAILCAVCARLRVARDRALALLFALLEDRQQRAIMDGGYGLCLRHFSRALALEPAPAIRAVLIEVENAKLARLHWELEESLRKVAWHYRPEARGEEQTAWRRAVLRFSGSLADSAG